jgi:hypothetical protein
MGFRRPVERTGPVSSNHQRHPGWRRDSEVIRRKHTRAGVASEREGQTDQTLRLESSQFRGSPPHSTDSPVLAYSAPWLVRHTAKVVIVTAESRLLRRTD